MQKVLSVLAVCGMAGVAMASSPSNVNNIQLDTNEFMYGLDPVGVVNGEPQGPQGPEAVIACCQFPGLTEIPPFNPPPPNWEWNPIDCGGTYNSFKYCEALAWKTFLTRKADALDQTLEDIQNNCKAPIDCPNSQYNYDCACVWYKLNVEYLKKVQDAYDKYLLTRRGNCCPGYY
jgi:hypothetical protein